MDSYFDRTERHARSEVTTSVAAQVGDPGTADVRVRLTTEAHEVELTSRVSREDLPKLIGDLITCLPEDERAPFLAAQLGHS
jgi:hypothetical protein